MLGTGHASIAPELAAVARPAVAAALQSLALLVAEPVVAGTVADSIGLVVFAALYHIPLAAAAVHSSRIR